MHLKLDNLYVIENGEKMVLYSIDNQSWVRVNKNYIQLLDLSKLREFLGKHHLNYEQAENVTIKKQINSLYLFLTRKCNMNCSFCSMDAGPFVDISNELTLDETIKLLKKLNDYNVKRIVISGGEPLLSSKFYPLIEFINKEMKKTQIIVQTNGAMISEKFCEKVSGKVARINISIESIYDIWADKREDLIKRLSIVRKHNIRMEFSFVATKKNRKYVYDYIELCRQFDAEAGIKIVSAIGGEKRFEDLSLTEMEILEFYHGIIDYIIQHKYTFEPNLETILGYIPIPRQGCSAYSLNSFSILPEGKICRCHSIKGAEFNYIGDIRANEGVEAVCEKDNVFSVDNKVYCKTCTYKHFCTGICGAEVYNCLDSTFYKPNSCEWKKILIKYYLWDYERGKTSSVWEGINERLVKKIEEINEKN